MVYLYSWDNDNQREKTLTEIISSARIGSWGQAGRSFDGRTIRACLSQTRIAAAIVTGKYLQKPLHLIASISLLQFWSLFTVVKEVFFLDSDWLILVQLSNLQRN